MEIGSANGTTISYVPCPPPRRPPPNANFLPSSHPFRPVDTATMAQDEEKSLAAAVAPARADSSNDNADNDNDSMKSPSSNGDIVAVTSSATAVEAGRCGDGDRDPASAEAMADGFMDVEEIDVRSSQFENFPSPNQDGSAVDVVEDPTVGLDSVMSTGRSTTLSLDPIESLPDEGSSPKYVVDNGEEILVWEDCVEDAQSIDEKGKGCVGKLAAASLGEDLESVLKSLQEVSKSLREIMLLQRLPFLLRCRLNSRRLIHMNFFHPR